MKMNTGKCHLTVSGTKYEHLWVKLGKDKIWESNNVNCSMLREIMNLNLLNIFLIYA